jgi:hypothetical protein
MCAFNSISAGAILHIIIQIKVIIDQRCSRKSSLALHNTLDIFMDCSSFVGHNRRDLGILQQENELISARWLSILMGKGLGI